jgi:predicted N-acetyltransferase YhbS
MASELVIRDARGEDRDAVRELTLRAYGEYAEVMEPSAWAGLSEGVRNALASTAPADRIVAEHEGKIVGSVMLFAPDANAYAGYVDPVRWPELRLLAVDPDARGLGVGRALVDECLRRARAQGATDLGLHTSRSMRAAIRLYQRLGFVRDPAHDFQPEGAELVEAYRLAL